ncbi:hypothetical protein IEQ34_012845 [Dendrobium chrysotoxum]|uniref:Uncharacterized protein n=1 Tax=Dendrobium chrysotoxum TaxID=161865 RepID=A0AAV7G6Q3_DENCH|nr:hypothetical protein IEQ34_012845 [Dendrobium chrysotoxum]
MRDMFTDIRKSGERPLWIGDAIWAELNTSWGSIEYSRRRDQNRQNRAFNVGGMGSSLHTGGLVPHTEHMRHLDEYTRLQESQTAAGEGPSGGTIEYSEYRIWLQAVGGMQHGRFYGLALLGFSPPRWGFSLGGADNLGDFQGSALSFLVFSLVFGFWLCFCFPSPACAGMAPNRLSDPGFLGGSLNSRLFLEALAVSSSSANFLDLKTSTFCGLPSLWISEQEIQALAVPFQFSLVGFFPSKHPSLDSIRRFFFNLKLNGEVSITLLDQIAGHPDLGILSATASASLLPPCILHGLGSIFSKPLKIDSATSIGSWPSMARVLVELDITKSYLDKVWLGPEKLGYVQQVVMEEFPPFCASCKCIEYVVGNCLVVSIELGNVGHVAGSDNVLLGNSSNSNIAPVDSVVVAVEPGSPALRLCVGEAGELNCGNNLKASFSCVDAVADPRELSLEVNSGDVVPSSPISPIQELVGYGGSSPFTFVERDVVSSPVNLDSNVSIYVQFEFFPNVISEGDATFTNIPISVMSSNELKAHVAKSVKNSVLVQTDWLVLDDSLSSSGREEEDLGDFEEDMAVHFVEQSHLNGVVFDGFMDDDEEDPSFPLLARLVGNLGVLAFCLEFMAVLVLSRCHQWMVCGWQQGLVMIDYDCAILEYCIRFLKVLSGWISSDLGYGCFHLTSLGWTNLVFG